MEPDKNTYTKLTRQMGGLRSLPRLLKINDDLDIDRRHEQPPQETQRNNNIVNFAEKAAEKVSQPENQPQNALMPNFSKPQPKDEEDHRNDFNPSPRPF